MSRTFWICLLIAGVFALPVRADNTPEVKLSLKDNTFVPKELAVPANQKVKVLIKNEDSEAAEFESFELNREKVVPANGEITVYLDPLSPGSYPFFDDFHRTTTTGTVIAK